MVYDRHPELQSKWDKALENTNEKVNNISMMVGYNKLSYFCRSFREYYGISPEKHRTNGGTIDA